MAKPKKSKKAATATPKKPVAPPPAKKKAVTKRPVKERTMDQLEQENQSLTERVEELEAENEELRAANDLLKAKLAEDSVEEADQPKWKRGIMPGSVYIRTDLKTGKFEKITKQEWDLIS